MYKRQVQHKPKDDDPILQYLNNEFNLDITLTAIPNEDIENTLSTRFAANDAPDVFVVDAGSYRSLAFTLSDAGMLIDAKELYPYMPLHQQYTTQGMIDFSTNANGEIPFVTKYGIQDGIWAAAIRSDWLETLGMEMPTTLDELEAIFDAYIEKYPGHYPAVCSNSLQDSANLFNTVMTSYLSLIHI